MLGGQPHFREGRPMQFTPCEASPILSPSLASLFPSALAFYYRKFYHTWRSGLYYRKSVCRLSVVCDIRAPYSGIETFGNISSPFCTLAIPSPPRKILRRLCQGNPSVGGVKRRRWCSKTERCHVRVSHLLMCFLSSTNELWSQASLAYFTGQNRPPNKVGVNRHCSSQLSFTDWGSVDCLFLSDFCISGFAVTGSNF